MRVTIKDVAVESAVSVATVSRVLSGKGQVSNQKRDAVQEAVRRLGYQPDRLAASLRSQTSSTVGMVVPDITNFFFPAVVQAAEQEFALAGLEIVFCDASNDTSVEVQRLETLLQRRVDALIVCPVDAKESARALRWAAQSTRLLQLERHALSELDFLGVDQADGMNQVARHLQDSGVHTAAFIGANARLSSVADREMAFHAACAASGLETLPSATFETLDVVHGRAYAHDLVARGGLPDALVCANDDIALGLLKELRLLGVSCPGDVKITGFDDVPAAGLLDLTTVAQPLRDLGREAARMIGHETSAQRRVLLRPTLVIRETTRAL